MCMYLFHIVTCFIVLDCVEPLGMQNGEIKDGQITASSAGKNEPAYNARLNLEGKSWCAAEKSKSEYLQVDLGEVYIFVLINEVVVLST